jgi:hypothetical protein
MFLHLSVLYDLSNVGVYVRRSSDVKYCGIRSKQTKALLYCKGKKYHVLGMACSGTYNTAGKMMKNPLVFIQHLLQ